MVYVMGYLAIAALVVLDFFFADRVVKQLPRLSGTYLPFSVAVGGLMALGEIGGAALRQASPSLLDTVCYLALDIAVGGATEWGARHGAERIRGERDSDSESER